MIELFSTATNVSSSTNQRNVATLPAIPPPPPWWISFVPRDVGTTYQPYASSAVTGVIHLRRDSALSTRPLRIARYQRNRSSTLDSITRHAAGRAIGLLNFASPGSIDSGTDRKSTRLNSSHVAL